MRLLIVSTLLLGSLFGFGHNAQAEEGMATASGAAVVAADASAANPNATEVAVAAADDKIAADSKIENKKESEIPLTLEAPKKATEESHPIFKIILVVSMMGAVGTGAFIFLKKYSKTNFAAGKTNQIKIITQHHLGPKKSLAIIRVAGESILVGITDQNINMIKSLSLIDDEVPEATPHHFSEVFGNSRDQDFTGVSQDAHAAADEDEEFSIRGVKDAVSKKLKGMRSFQ